MGQIKSLIHSPTIRMDDDATSKERKKPSKEDSLWEENEYDEGWDHIYDHNEIENRRRKLNRSDRYKYNKQDW